MTPAGSAPTATPPVPAATAVQNGDAVRPAGVPPDVSTTASSAPAERIRSTIAGAGLAAGVGRAGVQHDEPRIRRRGRSQLGDGQVEGGGGAAVPAGPHGAQTAQGVRRSGRPGHGDGRRRAVGDQRAAGRRRRREHQVRRPAEPGRQHRAAVGRGVDDEPHRQPVGQHGLGPSRLRHAVHRRGERLRAGAVRRRRRAPAPPAGPARRPCRSAPATSAGCAAAPGAPTAPITASVTASTSRRGEPPATRTGSAETMTLSR